MTLQIEKNLNNNFKMKTNKLNLDLNYNFLVLDSQTLLGKLHRRVCITDMF